MRLGLLARADDRGTGTQTWELYRHLNPAKTLVVDMGPLTPYRMHLDRFPDAEVAPFDGHRFPEGTLERFTQDLDVILSVETPYEWRLLDLCKDRGIKVVIQGNYEFCAWARDQDIPKPDLFLAPSTWNLDRWPQPVVHLPMPVDRERLPFRKRESARTFLHNVGHKAVNDRAGTETLTLALRSVRKPISIRFAAQSGLGHLVRRRFHRHLNVEVLRGDRDNYWSIYHDDVLLHPRRYGGLSLPLNEALSAGMVVIALDREPERSILPAESLVPAYVKLQRDLQPGPVDIYSCNPVDLAGMMDRLYEDDELVRKLSEASNQIAESISWDVLGPEYQRLLSSL